MPHAHLIIASSEADANLFYATKFIVPDPAVFFEVEGKKHLVLSDLEIDRAKHQAKVDVIYSLSEISEKVFKKEKETKDETRAGLPLYARVVDFLFLELGVKEVVVPGTFPALYFNALQKMGYALTVKPEPFFEARLVKSAEEKNSIRKAALAVEEALRETLLFLKKTVIRGDRVYDGNNIVTSEMLRTMVNVELMKRHCVATRTIVASGVQGSLPHHEGEGPIIPNTPIIFDIFPRDADTLYCADMTRTVVKGKASPMVQKMYDTVIKANQQAMKLVAPGVDSTKIHEEAEKVIQENGFETKKENGRWEGFFHSTGHGLGLDVHELPSVSKRGSILKEGHVVTIEPGLYFEKHGGIRIEDDVFVTANGFECLTQFPYFLEVDTANF